MSAITRKVEQVYLAKSASFFSDRVDLEDHDKFSVQIVTTNGSGFTSTVTLQVSNDYDVWTDVTSTTLPLTGTSDVQLYDVIQSSTGYSRIKVAITGGSADFEIDWV